MIKKHCHPGLDEPAPDYDPGGFMNSHVASLVTVLWMADQVRHDRSLSKEQGVVQVSPIGV